MKDKYGKVMTDEESVLSIRKEYYKGLMNGENEIERERERERESVCEREGERGRERRENDGERVNLEVEKISKEEVRGNMKRAKNGKAVGPDDIPVEVWQCLGDIALDILTKLYNRTKESDRIRSSGDTAL